MPVQVLRIAPDNSADGSLCRMNVILRQCPPDRLDVIEKAASGKKRSGENRKYHLAQSGGYEHELDQPCNGGRDCNNGEERRYTRSTPQRRTVALSI
jgi:hypothetical protein